MVKFLEQHQAFGAPGIEPRWTHADKIGVGTAYSTSSRLWYTLWSGIVTEVYYPTVDKPQIRDLQYLITDSTNCLHQERELESKVERVGEHGLEYRIANSDPNGRYQIIKEVIGDPHLPCLLQHTQIICSDLSQLKLYPQLII